MFHHPCTLIPLVITFAISTQTFGDEPTLDLEKQWHEAKSRYAQESEKLKQSVLHYLTTFETKARERGDTAKLKEINLERDAFNQRGEFPKDFNRSAYDRNRKSAQDELKKAHKALLISYLKQRKDTEAQALEFEFNELTAPTAKPPIPDASKDIPLRWLNTSYDSTLYHVRGKQWAEMANATKKVNWHLEEISRGSDYIELFLPDRQQTWRVFDRRVDFKVNGQWQWLSNGYWIDASGRQISARK